ncbi:hypothetical protein CONCODRAFT_80645 [Conidiobolus coronatus NRRL 28638]|uniref:Uncharacterized protein n=1 Tax=Conidiobolus coronatus (strain ATCC 28846 / CBS 209.66 / NRRL 28638) TaxID=796925 RepID=A0A137NT61_CONC2|nr:hypothetical protein CONCODRAFT_80645 [Conidiobolus coronatus NRRL 28638]|eukprot:KXN65926.1 hypothetical protein CONCODRAFT_80645 [Conidiobolus coronatus NRRL 28638]
MYQFLRPVFKITCFNIAYNFILNYFGKSNDKAKLIRKEFNSWIYYIFSIVTVSYLVEYTTIFYSHQMLTQSFLTSAKAGVTSNQVYGWRCSGAYYTETKCDLESEIRMWDNNDRFFLKPVNFTEGLIRGQVFNFGSMGRAHDSKISSGYSVNCYAGHTKYIKKNVKREKWDGPQPIHNPEDSCDCGKSIDTKISKYPSISPTSAKPLVFPSKF